MIDGLRIDTDPQARLFWRKKAHLLALVVKSRYGEEGWECHDNEPSGGETAVGGLFIKQRCEKVAGERKLLLDQRLYRRAGQPMNDFVNETHVEIRRAGGGLVGSELEKRPDPPGSYLRQQSLSSPKDEDQQGLLGTQIGKRGP